MISSLAWYGRGNRCREMAALKYGGGMAGSDRLMHHLAAKPAALDGEAYGALSMSSRMPVNEIRALCG